MTLSIILIPREAKTGMTTKKGNVVQNIHLNVLDKPKNNSDGSLIKKKNKKKNQNIFSTFKTFMEGPTFISE